MTFVITSLLRRVAPPLNGHASERRTPCQASSEKRCLDVDRRPRPGPPHGRRRAARTAAERQNHRKGRRLGDRGRDRREDGPRALRAAPGLAGDLDALEESIKEVDAWLAKNVDDLDGVDAAKSATCRTTRRRTRSRTENLEALDRVLAKVVATAPQGLSLHPRAEKALRLRSVDRDVTRGADQLRAALKNASVLRKDDTYQNLRSVREQKHHLDRVRSRFAQDASKLASKRLSNVFMRQDSVGGTTASAEQSGTRCYDDRPPRTTGF